MHRGPCKTELSLLKEIANSTAHYAPDGGLVCIVLPKNFGTVKDKVVLMGKARGTTLLLVTVTCIVAATV